MRLTGESAALPVNILTGFLGSGKTTLLRRILAAESYGDTAVLVNEFGEVGLDQVLVGEIAPDVVLLNSGCLCCTLRGELRDALADLLAKRIAGTVPAFKRVIIETTGLAQPSLMLSTVFADPQIRHHFTIGAVATAVDCLHAASEMPLPEWLAQVAAADVLVSTKEDLVDATQAERMRQKLSQLNPTALQKSAAALEIATLFERPPAAQLWTPHMAPARKPLVGDAVASGHGPETATVRVQADSPIDWEAFAVWLSMLLHAHGDRILRIKGLLFLTESIGPVVMQGVQHVIYPPEHLPEWNDLPRRTDLVFITRRLDVQRIRQSFETFVLKNRTNPL